MRRLPILFLCVALIPLAVLACDGRQGPMAPDSAPIVDAARVAATNGLGYGRDMVPYAARASFAPGSTDLTLCAPATASMALPSLLIGVGPHTHLGMATSEITIEYCEVTSNGLLGGGRFTHTARNGDSITGVWDALFTPPTSEFVAAGKPWPILADGGTGRFEGVTGYAGGSGTIDPTTGEGTFSVRGVISSVGSLR